MGRESYKTTSGLLDDFELHAIDVWFGPDEENDDDRIFCFFAGPAFQDGELVEEEYRERFSVGKGWEVVEEGAAVEHGSGRNQFNNSTGMGRLINAIVALDDDTIDLVADQGDAFEAKSYQNLRFHFERQIVSRWKDDDGEMVEWEMPLPTRVRTLKKKKGGRGKGSAGKSSGSSGSSGSKSDDSDEAKGVTKKQLVKLAGTFDEDDHDEFVVAALEQFPDIEGNDDLHEDVLDDEGSVWVKAHG